MRTFLSGTMKAKDSLVRTVKPVPWAAAAVFLIYRVFMFNPEGWQSADYMNILFATALAGSLLLTGLTLQFRSGGGNN